MLFLSYINKYLFESIMNYSSPCRFKSTVTPFTVKRKEVNYDALDMNNSSHCSLASLLYKNDQQASPSPPLLNQLPSDNLARTLIENKAAAEWNAKVQQLEKELKQATHDQQTWRHKCRLLENEREKFQSFVKDQCEKDKELLHIEIKTLKETHISKVQEMSSTMAQLQRTVGSLRDQLSKHGLEEEQFEDDEAIDAMLSRFNYKEEVEYIKNAYHFARQSNKDFTSHPLWSDVQTTTQALQHEIELFHAWKAVANVPIEDLARLMRDDERSSTTTGSSLRKTLFGRKGSNKRK
ncbi:hypothetical protein BDA99DRAFT_493856 [Phascolomyces articulosus]|uniref:Uncharacterized protein n=1 Tax=Phascolomyces articulosus TaxID=60185 RepID=A0AAD5PJE5_9FUNG|nr:hypothetical protein BDA99DRAFT_493856 [Phascolomyces articulosus]